ncbi:MAG: flagellar hook-basal body complex protein [Schwartzia succinivorans]|uniref:flagellar hook-basal body complex protein n=1 Tax=Schwartzia succinivorans TaxID=55507 RepID=UPI002354204B|nr:flagellar hook-basal body complex protein [Schwartzia succinivorans]MBE6097548.1 flagellar hook-basal body complex protein [Schwartzia succinivorans]
MMRSLFSGVSGLKNHQTRMDVIGNNISNVNTTGFKSSRTSFVDMLSQTLSGASAPTGNLGGTNPKQIGLGSSVAAIQTMFTNGSVQSTGKNTDLCLSSENALFILNTGNGTAYTRNGAFEFDADGNYVQTGTGYFVEGWMANNGSIDTGSTPGIISIPAGKTMAPASSTTGTYTNNINSEVPTITEMSGGTYETVTLSGSGEELVVSKKYNPVSLTLDNGKSIDNVMGSEYSDYQYGYSTTTDGNSAKASAKQNVIVHTAGGNFTGKPETTYTVGGNYTTDKVTSGTATGTAANPVTLYLSDGTEHIVTDGSSYVCGTDTYTYPAGSGTATATVIGYANTYKITQLDVEASPSYGMTLKVGGYASHPVQSATATATNTVIINGATEGQIGTTYTIGDTFTYGNTTNPGDTLTGDSSKTVILTLSNGDTATGAPGTPYTVGDAYTVTQNGTSVNLTITGLAYQETITSLEERSNIKTITYQKPERKASSDNPVIVKMSDGTQATQTKGTFEVGHSLPMVTTLTVYDTLGGKHDVAVYFTKTGVETDTEGNTTSTWAVALDTDHTTEGEESTQTITEADGTTTTLKMNTAKLVFDSVGTYKSGSGQPTLTLTNGSQSPQNVQLDFTALTQYASGSTVAGTCDGNAAGTLSSVSIDKTGTITGTYTNGKKQVEAQVALQRFTNPAGLTKIGDSLYEDSNNAGKSGEPNTADAIGATITPAALEMSNVDIAEQFTDMITTQRGYQANSKIITVSDEMLETLINMKR